MKSCIRDYMAGELEKSTIETRRATLAALKTEADNLPSETYDTMTSNGHPEIAGVQAFFTNDCGQITSDGDLEACDDALAMIAQLELVAGANLTTAAGRLADHITNWGADEEEDLPHLWMH